MAVLAFAVCAAAAYRLGGTPLFVPACAVVVLNGLCFAWRSVGLLSSQGGPPRAITALSHVTTALAGFFLFVSFALH